MEMMQKNALGPLDVKRKTGKEHFILGDKSVGIQLLDFWQWSVSDLASNATRGRLAEFIVASALKLDNGVRNEWDAYDLRTASGLRIEVKSCAYVQSWYQKALSSIVFSIRKTRAWSAVTNTIENGIKRQADVYIFALLAHQEKSTLEPLNLDQWHFYLVLTSELDKRTRSQHSITLKSLQELCKAHVSYNELYSAVQELEKIAGTNE